MWQMTQPRLFIDSSPVWQGWKNDNQVNEQILRLLARCYHLRLGADCNQIILIQCVKPVAEQQYKQQQQ